MIEITAFNSGRFYGPNNQRVAYCILANQVFFVDVDRHIDGRFSNYDHLPVNPWDLMAMYDKGGYAGIDRKYLGFKDTLMAAAARHKSTEKGSYTISQSSRGLMVRLVSTDEDEDDCGIAYLCNECADLSTTSSDGRYTYHPWEDDLEGDVETCRECGCLIY